MTTPIPIHTDDIEEGDEDAPLSADRAYRFVWQRTEMIETAPPSVVAPVEEGEGEE